MSPFVSSKLLFGMLQKQVLSLTLRLLIAYNSKQISLKKDSLRVSNRIDK